MVRRQFHGGDRWRSSGACLALRRFEPPPRQFKSDSFLLECALAPYGFCLLRASFRHHSTKQGIAGEGGCPQDLPPAEGNRRAFADSARGRRYLRSPTAANGI